MMKVGEKGERREEGEIKGQYCFAKGDCGCTTALVTLSTCTGGKS